MMRRGEVRRVDETVTQDEAQGVCDHIYRSDEAIAFADIRCPWKTVWSDKLSLVQRAAHQHARDNGHTVSVHHRSIVTYRAVK